MSTLQLNPVGMPATAAAAIALGMSATAAEGYISSITIYTGGAPVVLTPAIIAGSPERITVSNAALSNLISGQRSPVGGTMTMVQA
jgi:hypothetical protein